MSITELHPDRAPLTAWVLGGGGNLGSIQVGMLRALVARGERPDVVLGCSVGSLNALATAADPTPAGIEVLRRVWVNLDSDDVFPSSSRFSGPWHLFRRGLSLYDDHGLRRLLDQCAPYPRFEDYPVDVQCVATSLRTGRARWFHSGDITEPVLASAALPGAFPPVRMGGELFIDGGVTENVPIARALALGATRVVVLHVGNFERPRPEPKRPIDVLLQSFSISRNARFGVDIAHAPPHVDLVVLPGIDPGNVKRTDFSRTADLIERATAAAAAYLDLRDKDRPVAPHPPHRSPGLTSSATDANSSQISSASPTAPSASESA